MIAIEFLKKIRPSFKTLCAGAVLVGWGQGAAPSFLSDPSFATDAGNPVFLWKLCLGSAMQVFIELLYFLSLSTPSRGLQDNIQCVPDAA